MNRKRNTIIAIIITFIVICVFVIFFVYSKKKQEEEMWIMSLNAISKEELEYELSIEIPPENLFNDETKNNFEKLIDVEDITDNKNKIKETNTNKKITGLITLKNTNNKNHRLNDKIYWQDYFTPGHKQIRCGNCGIMAVVAGLEAYFNKKYELKPKISLSRQYLTSYTSFMGCSGNINQHKINLLSLGGKNKDLDTRNAYLKQKIKKEIDASDQFITGTNILKTKTQYSIAAGEVPFGIPKTVQMPPVHYDSCEIVEIDPNNPNFAVTGMDLRILDEIYSKKEEYKDNWEEKRKTLFTKDFCPDKGDIVKNKFTAPKRNDNFEKLFVENYFKIDNSKDSATTIRLIKEALKVSPLVVGTAFYKSILKHKSKGAIWEKPPTEEIHELGHSWVITGWGVEENSGREYWILKTSWSDGWFGENCFFRVWTNDPALNIEKQPIYGFSGEMVTIQGKELNKLLEDVKREEKERKKQKEEKIDTKNEKQKPIQEQKEKTQYPKILPQKPDPKNINPLKGYNIINAGYQDTKYISDNKCTTIVSCIYDKLAVFYTDKQNEFS
ncbi:MAG TPA: C1 family peptidase [Candidatus Diapherotrites archaeon]|jgi:hypothetical protein|nr:C1 family peptidase [Candidatus Diapherotrites archaeon]